MTRDMQLTKEKEMQDVSADIFRRKYFLSQRILMYIPFL